MIRRHALTEIRQLLAEFPAVCILGPRQVGKTTLALQLAGQRGSASAYLDLELPSDMAKLADPESFFQGHYGKLVILDEVQRVPSLFVVLRSVIDRQKRSGHKVGQFLLLGSASGDLLQQSAESLAGRLAYAELTPFLAIETEDQAGIGQERLWIRGGFPESFLARNDEASLRWRRQFVTTYLERDIPQLGPRIPAHTLRRLWTMLAHEQGQPINASKIAASLGVSGQTVARYLDLLCDLMLVRRLQPWARNAGKRLARTPKVFVRDSGLVHALLDLPTRDAVLGHPVAGGSWEGWVIENLIACAPPGTTASFYRTSAGAEVDLVLELPRRQRWAIEVKRSKAPAVSKGFHLGAADVGAARRLVVYPGDERFPLPGGVTAQSLPSLMQELVAL